MPKAIVNGVQLRYEIEGEGAPLVLLNGVFQSVEKWDALLPHLRGFRVLRYDMRGQGRSAAPDGVYTPEVHAADLRALLEQLRIERPSILGLSNGGVVAQLAAIASAGSPGAIDRVILACTTPRLDPSLRAKFASWLDALDAGGVALRLRVSAPWAFGRSFLARQPELLSERAIADAVVTAPTLAAHRALLRGLLALDDLRPRLPKVKAKTLVLAGAEDVLFPPEYGAEIAESVPGAELRVLAGVGHQPPIEAPAAFAAEVTRFLGRSGS